MLLVEASAEPPEVKRCHHDGDGDVGLSMIAQPPSLVTITIIQRLLGDDRNYGGVVGEVKDCFSNNIEPILNDVVDCLLELDLFKELIVGVLYPLDDEGPKFSPPQCGPFGFNGEINGCFPCRLSPLTLALTVPVFLHQLWSTSPQLGIKRWCG